MYFTLIQASFLEHPEGTVRNAYFAAAVPQVYVVDSFTQFAQNPRIFAYPGLSELSIESILS
jgi:hypothetical protein